MTMPTVHSKNKGPKIQIMILWMSGRGATRLPLAGAAVFLGGGVACCMDDPLGWSVFSQFFRFQTVSQTTHGQDAYAARLQFFAQAVDIDLDGVRGDFLTPLTEQIHKLVLADHATAARQENLQQAGFTRRQLQGLIVYISHATFQVEAQALVMQQGAAGAGTATRQGA